jgi:hypothetical protein
LGVDRSHGGGDHVLGGLGDLGQDVAGEVDLAALPRRALHDGADRFVETGVGIGDHELDAVVDTVGPAAALVVDVAIVGVRSWSR